MAQAGTVTGWKLPPDQRSALLERFPPLYEKVIADYHENPAPKDKHSADR